MKCLAKYYQHVAEIAYIQFAYYYHLTKFRNEHFKAIVKIDWKEAKFWKSADN